MAKTGFSLSVKKIGKKAAEADSDSIKTDKDFDKELKKIEA